MSTKQNTSWIDEDGDLNADAIGRSVRKWLLISASALLVLFFVGYAWNIFVTQPLERQNTIHGANWCIAQTANITNTYNDYLAAQQRLPIDQAALAQFKQDNGDPKNYGFYQEQQYQELQTNVTGDQQAIIRLAASYNAIRDNPDAQSCQASFPAGYPASLAGN